MISIIEQCGFIKIFNIYFLKILSLFINFLFQYESGNF